MYSHIIEEMAKAVANSIGVFGKKDFDKIKEAIGKCWVDKIAITWSVDDVISVQNMSKKKARQVLVKILNELDASVGVNWDVVKSKCNKSCL